MRKILVVFVLAVLLVVVLSVPALAGASDPPYAWGQHRAEANAWLHSEVGENWGHDTLPCVKEYAFAPVEDAGLGLANWGEFVNLWKATYEPE